MRRRHKAWAMPPRPLRCRLGLHRWHTDHQGTRRCQRPACWEIRPHPLLSPTIERVLRTLDQPPAGDIWVTCTRHDGKILYEGPIPIPPGMDELSAEDLHARRFNTYEFTELDLAQGEDADAG